MTLDLIKIEEGLVDGEVLFHKLVSKTDEEARAIRASVEKRRRERERRQKEQAANVRKKEEEKKRLKEKSLRGMKKKMEGDKEDEEEEDDDRDWFRKEVGAEPERDMFEAPERKRKAGGSAGRGYDAKRFKGASLGSARKMAGTGSGGRRRTNAGPGQPSRKKSAGPGASTPSRGGKKRPLQKFNSQGVGPDFRGRGRAPKVLATRGSARGRGRGRGRK